MISPTQKIGLRIEGIACEFLIRHGLMLIHKNFRSPYGEIDLIMQEHNTLVFVEVRYRKNGSYGQSVETISPAKKRRLIQTAFFYLKEQRHLKQASCRFDLIGFDHKQRSTWIKNAFAVEY